MRITSRLKIISTTLTLSLVLIIPILVWTFVKYQHAQKNYALAESIEINFFERDSISDRYFLYREDHLLAEWEKKQKTSEELLDLTKVTFPDKDRRVVDELKQSFEKSSSVFYRIIRNGTTLKTNTQNHHVYNELDKRLYSQLLLKSASIRDLVRKLKDESARETEKIYHQLAFIVVPFTFLLSIIFILTLRHICRFIIDRLSEIHRDARIIASGDLSYRIKSDGVDEFSELAQSINFMTDKLESEIIERKRNEAILLESKQQAEAGVVAKSRFLATMGHEIRTPLNGILGMAQLLKMQNVSESERQKSAQIILNSGNTLLALLNDILDISKVEAGKVLLEKVCFEPVKIIDEIRELFLATVTSKDLVLEADCKNLEGRQYLGDPTRLRQILWNLMSNAVKFTDQGKIRIVARECELNERNAIVEFCVYDSGIGIPNDHLPLIFEPFMQSDSSTTRKFGGTGLGLSIVNGLIKLMGGTLEVHSVEGEGSHFCVKIPMELASENVLVQMAEVYEEKSLPPSARVLVVDDDEINCKVVMTFLTKLGLSVKTARNGQEALDAIREGDCADFILMDLQMPIMDGCASTLQIRQWESENGKTPLPIIALTAATFPEDHKRCLEVGMNDILNKPITLEGLRAMLSKWLPH